MRLIVWDFDGVLNANVRDGQFVWSDKAIADIGMDPNAFTEFVFHSGIIRNVVSGQLDLLDAVSAWLATHGPHWTADAFLEFWFDQDAIPDPEVTGWMQAHPGRKAIGTNNEARRAAYIEEVMGYGPMVEKLFASGRMGVAKPDERFFREIERWSGLKGPDILLIDDSRANVEAAEALGWQGYHFTPETRADLPAVLGLAS